MINVPTSMINISCMYLFCDRCNINIPGSLILIFIKIIQTGRYFSVQLHCAMEFKLFILELIEVFYLIFSLLFYFLNFGVVVVVFLGGFSVRLLSVLRGHSVLSSPPLRPMTSDFEGFSTPDFIHYIFFPIFFPYLNSKERASISLLMLSAKQGNYWYHFYYVLVGGLNPGPPALFFFT